MEVIAFLVFALLFVRNCLALGLALRSRDTDGRLYQITGRR